VLDIFFIQPRGWGAGVGVLVTSFCVVEAAVVVVIGVVVVTGQVVEKSWQQLS